MFNTTSHRLDPRFARVVGAFGLSHIHVSHIRIMYVGNYLPQGLRPRAKQFFLILPVFSKNSAIIWGTDSLNGNLKENGSIEWAENWPGGSLSGLLSIPMISGGTNQSLFLLSTLFVRDCIHIQAVTSLIVYQEGFEMACV